MSMWEKIAYALLLGAMVALLAPRAKAMLRQSPKATGADWNAVVLPLLGVILFILLLIWLVRH